MRTGVPVLAWCCAWFASAFIVGEAMALEFAADRVVKKGKQVVTTHINAKDDRWRFEFTMPEEGASIVIVQADQHRAWQILSQRRMYREIPIPPKYRLVTAAQVEGEVSREYVGDETLHGHLTGLYEVRVMRGPVRLVLYQWVTKAEGFPIKTVNTEEDWSEEYRHLKFVEQSPWLFELPRRLDREGATPSDR